MAALLTSLLTSAVLASPDTFRQSPSDTWRQLITPVLATGQGPRPDGLADCP